MGVRARPLVSVKHRESASAEGRDFRTLSESDAPSAVPKREAVPDMGLNYELDPLGSHIRRADKMVALRVAVREIRGSHAIATKLVGLELAGRANITFYPNAA